MIDFLRHPEKHFTFDAMLVLGEIGPAAEAAGPALVPFMMHPDADFRNVAVHAWAAVSPAAKPAVPRLLELLTDELLGDVAAELLKAIDPEAAKQAGVKPSGGP